MAACWRVRLKILPTSVSQVSENVEASTSPNTNGLQDLYRDNFTYVMKIYDGVEVLFHHSWP
jgi:hypothetical protein